MLVSISRCCRYYKPRHIVNRVLSESSRILEHKQVENVILNIKNLTSDDGISILKHPATGRVVIVVGTVHVSGESVNDVRRVIQSYNPDTVMIELDQKRVGLETEELAENGFILPKHAVNVQEKTQSVPTSVSYFTAMSSALIEPVLQIVQRVAAFVFQRTIVRIYSSVEKVGLNAGEEFEVAYKIGREINAKILLGDRETGITFDRLASALLKTKFTRLSTLFDKLDRIEARLGIDYSVLLEPPSKEQVEQFAETIKQKQFIHEFLAACKEEVPELYDAFIGERDRYMAKAIMEQDESKLLVGVVGIGHLAGMEQILTIEGGYYRVEPESLPSK